MAIDTHILNVPGTYAVRPPDWSHVGSDFMGGLAGAYLAKKKAEREADWASGDVMAPSPPGPTERFFQAYVNASGEETLGANPLLREQVKRLTFDNALSRNVVTMMNEVGQLTPDQIPAWQLKHLAILASPPGQQVMNQLDDIYKQTSAAKVRAVRVEDIANAATIGLDIEHNPEHAARWNKIKAYPQLEKQAVASGVMFDPRLLPEGTFDPQTGTVDPEKAAIGIAQMKPSIRYATEAEIANKKLAYQERHEAIIQQFREGKMNLEQMSLALRSLYLQTWSAKLGIDAAREGFEIQGLPPFPTVQTPAALTPGQQITVPPQGYIETESPYAAPGTSPTPPQAFTVPSTNAPATGPRLVRVERPPTTAFVTRLQEQQAQTGQVFALGQQLAPLLTMGTTGIPGNLTRGFEGLAAQVIPDFKIGPATDAATLAKDFQAAIIKGLKSDSNIAERERQTLENAMPQPTEWSKGAPQAKATLATQLERWGILSRNNSELLHGKMYPGWLTGEEIAGMLERKEINRAQADDLMANNGWRLIATLRQGALREPNKYGYIPKSR